MARWRGGQRSSNASPAAGADRLVDWVLQQLCRAIVHLYYRHVETDGTDAIPQGSPVLLCANHANALVDFIVIQAVCPRAVRPLTRSGLFRNPLLQPLLRLLRAVPVYRRTDPGVDTSRNIDSFVRCYRMFAEGEALLIFPEGQSHSDPRLRELRTGAARLALGAAAANGVAPTVFPVGLTFSAKGRFRSSVLVKVGQAVDLGVIVGVSDEDAVRRVTVLIEQGLADVTLNADSWEEIDLSRRIERFFALRRGRYRRGTLAQRFKALKRLLESQRLLCSHDPERVRQLSRRLARFERLCERFGICDYQLTVSYRLPVVTRFLGRVALLAVVALPLALWGLLNSAVPLLAVRIALPRLAHGTDQYDTARIGIAAGTFLLAWSVQIWLVHVLFGALWAVVYACSLPPATAMALVLHRQKDSVRENIWAFFVFWRRHELRDYLLGQRRGLEAELARLAQLVKRSSN